ncbi:MAG: linear amide C-N hydrolase [Chitinispirillaceae bacterium]|nr:linear amide C-N hydrolase [Chitinispirillaceae bacterium]
MKEIGRLTGLASTLFVLTSIPSIACTVISFSNQNEKLVGRNWDYGDSTNSIQFIPQRNRHPAMILFHRKSYVTDGMNQHGLCMAFTGVPNTPRRLPSPFKRWSISVHIIKDILKECKTVEEVEYFFNRTSIWWGRPWGQQIAYLVADSTGRSCIIDFIGKEMVISEKTDSIQILLNHHPTRIDIEYEDYGCGACERQSTIVHAIANSVKTDGLALMSILAKVSVKDGIIAGSSWKDRVPWGRYTTFSNVYDLKNLTVNTAIRRKYEQPVTIDLRALIAKCNKKVTVDIEEYKEMEYILEVNRIIKE